MKKLEKTTTIIILLTLTSALIGITKAQAPTENMKTFFESKWPGIEIQVNATRETLPEEAMTIILLVKSKAEDIYIEYFNLTIFGFIEGQNKSILGGIYQDAFPLNYSETKRCNKTLTVRSDVWGTTYGELAFQYSIGGFSYSLSSLGFTTTYVKNVYLENLEEQFQSLNENFTELQQNYTELAGKYDELSKSIVELDNTRRAMIILAITTVIFAATTIYSIMRKPKQYW